MQADWTPPEPRAGLAGSWDRFIGPGATRAELGLILGAALAAGALAPLWAVARGPDWSPLQLGVTAVLAMDLVGGVVANATSTAKRWYHRAGQGAQAHFSFVAVHFVHPLLVAWLFRGMDWIYFGVVYGFLLLSTLLVLRTPLYLKRPLALLLTVVGLVIGQAVLAPTPGLEWFIPIFYLKLLVGHLLPETPFAPPGTPASRR